MRFLVRPASEVTIKSKPVRRRKMRMLRQNIRQVLIRLDSNIEVIGSFDRVDIQVPDGLGLTGPVVDALQRIPGISLIQEVAVFPLVDLAEMSARALELFSSELAGKTFAVRARRQGEHTFSSSQVQREVGAALLHGTEARGVDLKAPEVDVRIEIRDSEYHIARRVHAGLGGYPLGSVDSVLSLMSGGYDSSVAAYLMYRRGVRSHFLFFNLGGTAHETGVRQVVHYLWSRYGASHSAKFISVPFDGVIAEIMASVNHRHWGVILKRQMLRAAEQIAAVNGTSAIVTGEAVAQVSSQTLVNLNVIDQACQTVVLRPLVAMDKRDIINIAVDIGTEPYARTMPEYCGIISKQPVTKARGYRIEADEVRMNPEVLQQAIEARSEMPIDRLTESLETPEHVELISTPAIDDVLVDVRHPSEQERAPLEATNNQVISIPFYELNSRAGELEHGTRYLLFCDRGVMSRMQAAQLQASGHANVQVYSPAGRL